MKLSSYHIHLSFFREKRAIFGSRARIKKLKQKERERERRRLEQSISNVEYADT